MVAEKLETQGTQAENPKFRLEVRGDKDKSTVDVILVSILGEYMVENVFPMDPIEALHCALQLQRKALAKLSNIPENYFNYNTRIVGLGTG